MKYKTYILLPMVLNLFDAVINKTTSNATGNDLSGEMKTFYSDYLIDMAEPELVQRMIDEGHVVGNHSWKHPNYSGLSVEEAEQDLMKLHDYVKENFNYTMRYFRFPAGNFSERALAEVQQLGYKSLFWSFAYKDWLTDDQPDEAESLQKIVDSACPGMIYLLHAVSKTNANVLADVIDGVVAKGFTWGDPSKI